MTRDTVLPGSHTHEYLGRDHERNERRTWIVVAISVAMMVIEIVAGTLFGSMALVADGWHMFTHASVLAIAAMAYHLARRHAGNRRFTFGTGKIGGLEAFGSAVVLAVVALLIVWESLLRLANPASIAYGQAIAVAVLGLAINALCAVILGGHGHGHAREVEHAHGHDHGHDHSHDHASQDHAPAADNTLRAAYMPVLADALTSVLSILALVLGGILGLRCSIRWPASRGR